MFETLTQKRESFRNQTRKKEHSKLFSQHRKQFVNLDELLFHAQRASICNCSLEIELPNQTLDHLNNTQIRNILNQQCNYNIPQYLTVDLRVWLALSNTSSQSTNVHKIQWFQKLLQTVSCLQYPSPETINKIIQIAHAFVLKLNIQQNQLCQNIIKNTIQTTPLNDRIFSHALETLRHLCKNQIFTLSQQTKVLQTITFYLGTLTSDTILLQTIEFLNLIFDLQEDSVDELFTINVTFINIVAAHINRYSHKVLESILMTIINLALNGPSTVSHLLSSSLLAELVFNFQNKPPTIKEHIVRLFNTVLIVSNKQQIIRLCQIQLLQLIGLTIESEYSLESLQLGLKMLHRIIKIAIEIYNEFPALLQLIAQRFSQSHILKNQDHRDAFVREQSAKLQNLIYG